MPIEDDVYAIVSTMLNRPNQPLEQRMREALRVLSKWRASQLAARLAPTDAPQVQGGPFAGMTYVADPSEGCFLPKIFGTYEQELHHLVEGWKDGDYAQVVNVGCAEGYYAVGLARNLGVPIHAFDIDTVARERCTALAADNDVATLVQVGGELTPEGLDGFSGRTLVLCDIEGGEKTLLDPTAAPALKHMDVLVEAHESFVPGVTETLVRRFAASHDVTHIANGARRVTTPEALHGHDTLDQALALWEWRIADPGWLWLRAKSR